MEVTLQVGVILVEALVAVMANMLALITHTLAGFLDVRFTSNVKHVRLLQAELCKIKVLVKALLQVQQTPKIKILLEDMYVDFLYTGGRLRAHVYKNSKHVLYSMTSIRMPSLCLIYEFLNFIELA